MLPDVIVMRNYRSFATPHRLRLRPITLLYGSNNAGKSTLLRSLPLLADSIGWQGLDALNLEGRLHDLELDFDNLRYKGRAETADPTLGLSLVWEKGGSLTEIHWDLWEEADWRRTVVRHLAIRGASGRPLADALWQPRRGENRTGPLLYRVERGEGEAPMETEIEFRGLQPETSPWVDVEIQRELDERLKEFSASVLWLRSLRPAPPRWTRWAGAVRWSLAPNGLDAPLVLAAEPQVRDEVSAWYRRHLGLELIVDDTREREVRVALSPVARTSYALDLIDTGEGVSQILPVLTALGMARQHAERGGPGILAIEEPEAHLHPHLQRALADKACEIAATARPRIVLETHSEHILLAVRLQVVKRKLAPEDVGIYWVRQLEDGSSLADEVHLDEMGRFAGNWPPSAFTEDLELAAAIQEARDARESA